jgi:hypothetical protein
LDVGAERDGPGTAAIVSVLAEAYAFDRLRGFLASLGYPFFPLRRQSTVCDTFFRHSHDDMRAGISQHQALAT